MKAARFYDIKDIRIEDVSNPKIIEGDDVIIKVKTAGVCGSDISKYGKTGPHIKGEVMGHEFSGEVFEVGPDVQDLKVGDAVAVCPALPCFKCSYCLQGKFSECRNMNILGNKEVYGCFAEYVKISRKNVIKLPEGIDYETAACIEPACIAFHGINRSNIKVGDTIVVLGAGTIGLFLIQWARVFGATRIISVDIFDEKLRLAKEFGADICMNSKLENPVEKVMSLTDNNGVDVAIEAAGTSMTCGEVLGYSKKGGTVLYAGVPYADVLIPRKYFEKIIRNQLNITGTWFANSFPFPGVEWTSAIHFMKNGQIKAKPMITHRIGIEEVGEIFEKIYKHDVFFGKVMIEF